MNKLYIEYCNMAQGSKSGCAYKILEKKHEQHGTVTSYLIKQKQNIKHEEYSNQLPCQTETKK